MRTMKRTLAAGAMSLPLAFGLSGVALADSGSEAAIRGSIEVRAEQSSEDEYENRDEGILEELLGGFTGEDDEFEENDRDQSEHYEDDGLLAGLL